MPESQPLPMCVALRVEGDNWCAYCAKHGTMEGALFLGAIRLGLVENHPQRKHTFQRLMINCMSDAIRHSFGDIKVTWSDPALAPEHERSKS